MPPGSTARCRRGLMAERLAELRERQDDITAARRDALIGATVEVLVDAPGVGRTHREAPEIDGIVQVPTRSPSGSSHDVLVVDALGPDLVAEPVLVSAGAGGAVPDVSHDPNALATWANAVTVARLLVSPVLFALITGGEGSWAALALWFVLCASDGIDGYLARRHGSTRSGAFLDPLADKVLVLGAMFTLVGRACSRSCRWRSSPPARW